MSGAQTLGRSGPGEGAGAFEHGVEHGLGELAGEGVLLAHVVAAEDPAAVAHIDLDPMGEPRSGRDTEDAAQTVVGEAAERDEHACVEQGELPLEERTARVALGGGRLVGGRRASHRGGDPRAGEAEAVPAVGAGRLVGEAGAVQRRVEEVAGAVTREHAAGAVRAVGGRSQAHDHDPSVRIAEGGDGSSPVVVVPEGGPLLVRHLLPPGNQPGARGAAHHLVLQHPQGLRPGTIHEGRR